MRRDQIQVNAVLVMLCVGGIAFWGYVVIFGVSLLLKAVR